MFDAKTATNSPTSTLSQVICAEFFKRGYYTEHHKKICDLYRERRDVMIESIDKFFPEGGGMGNNCMRISFGGVNPEKIRIGVEKLGNLICAKLK